MKAKNKIIIGIAAVLLAACTPTAEDGKRYLGNWHTDPVPSNRAGNQYFIEITADTPPNYLATFTILGDVSKGSGHNKDLSQRYKSVYSMKDGKLIAERNSTIYLDSQGVLHYKSIEYRK